MVDTSMPHAVASLVDDMTAPASIPEPVKRGPGRPPGSKTNPAKLAAVRSRDGTPVTDSSPEWTPERVADVIELPCVALSQMLGVEEPEPERIQKLARGLAPAADKHRAQASVELVAILSLLAFLGPMLMEWITTRREKGGKGAGVLPPPRVATSFPMAVP